MANFNVNFGQNVISNAQKNRQLALEKERIDNAREAAAASAANQASATFWSRVNAEEQNANRKRELEEKSREFDAEQSNKNREIGLKEDKQAHDLSWDDAVKKQEIDNASARADYLRSMTQRYDMAFESDKAKAEEEMRQAGERAKLLNTEMGSLILSVDRNGGSASPSQLAEFNKATGANYDFFGNSMTFRDANGQLVTRQIGDGNGMYVGSFQKTKSGDYAYGDDNTPLTSMTRIPNGYVQTVLNSAYGREYRAESSGARSSSGTRGGLTFEQQKELRSLGSDGKADKQMFEQRMKLMENYQKQYDAIATLNPQDPRLAGLQQKVDKLGGLLGVSTGISGADELSRAFGLTGGDAELAEDKGEYYVEGAREDGVKRVMDETQTDPNTGRPMKTGRKVINTDYERKDGSTSYTLGEGEKEYESETGNVVTVRNGKVIARKANEGEMPEYDEDNARTTYTLDGGKKLLVPDGKVVQMQNGQRYKSDGGRLVPTTDKISWDESHSESLMKKISADKEAEAKRTAAENAANERKARDERNARDAAITQGWMKSRGMSAIPRDEMAIKAAQERSNVGSKGMSASGKDLGGWDDRAAADFKSGFSQSIQGTKDNPVIQRLKPAKLGEHPIDKAVVSAAKNVVKALTEGPINQHTDRQADAEAIGKLIGKDVASLEESIKSGKLSLIDLIEEISSNLDKMDASKQTDEDRDRHRFYDIRSGKSAK